MELYTVSGYNYSNGSIVSVDMDAVGVKAPTASMSTDTIEPLL